MLLRDVTVKRYATAFLPAACIDAHPHRHTPTLRHRHTTHTHTYTHTNAHAHTCTRTRTRARARAHARARTRARMHTHTTCTCAGAQWHIAAPEQKSAECCKTSYKCHASVVVYCSVLQCVAVCCSVLHDIIQVSCKSHILNHMSVSTP